MAVSVIRGHQDFVSLSHIITPSNVLDYRDCSKLVKSLFLLSLHAAAVLEHSLLVSVPQLQIH